MLYCDNDMSNTVKIEKINYECKNQVCCFMFVVP